MVPRILVLLLLFSLFNCEKNDSNPIDSSNGVRKDIELINNLRAQSVSTLQIGNRKYILKAALWRDFMPISPPNGRPMIAINRLISADSSAIPSNIQLVKQYVILNDSIWISDYENASNQTNEFTIERTSINGPKWGPNVGVDVIAKVTDTNTNTDHHLIVKNVNIDRTN